MRLTIPSGGGGGVTPDEEQIYYVGKHGNDANSGLNIENAVLTFGQAITLVSAQTPSSSNKFKIQCFDNGVYTENITVPSFSYVEATGAELVGNQVLSDSSMISFGRFTASSGAAISKTSGSGRACAFFDSISLTGSASGFIATAGMIAIQGQVIYVADGYGVGSGTTAAIHISVDHIDVTGSGYGVGISSTGVINGKIASINVSGVGGTGVYAASTSELNLLVGFLNGNGETAYNVAAAGATLNLVCGKIDGTQTNSGTANFVASDTGIDVAGDTDATGILGRLRFDSRVADNAFLSHYDNTASNNYALRIGSADTFFNSTGTLYFRISDADTFTVTAAFARLFLTAESTTIGLGAMLCDGGFAVAKNLSCTAVNLPEISTPATPSAGYKKIYTKSTGHVFSLDDAGVEKQSMLIGDAPTAHAASHTDGSDDIQDATSSVKGLATAAQIAKLDNIGASFIPTGIEFGNTTQDYDVDGNTWVPAVAGGTLGGIPDAGSPGHTLADCISVITSERDGTYLNVREGTGAASATNPLTVQFLFSGLTDFGLIHYRSYYQGSVSHNMEVQLWNYITVQWDKYDEFSGQSEYVTRDLGVENAANYISGGAAILQFIHTSSGNASHSIQYDHVSLTGGTGGTGGQTQAASVSYVPSGDLSATNVQSAIDELESEKTANNDTDLSANSWFLDEDNMASDDDTKVASQQSVKAYADDNFEPTLPLTTRGDVLIRDAANATARLAVGSATYVLTSDGTDVSWSAASGGGTILNATDGGRPTLVRDDAEQLNDIKLETPASTDTGAETVTLNAGHNWVTGMGVTPSSTANGLTAGTLYYINVATNVVSFHTNLADADAGTSKVDLTGAISELGVALVYYEPKESEQIALYDGSTSWDIFDVPDDTRLDISSLTADTNYDIFMYDSSGTPTLEATAWTNDTTRATALVRQDGVWSKTGALTRRFVGSVRIESNTGQSVDYEGGVDNGSKRFVSSANNLVQKSLVVADSTNSWNYGPGGIRAANNNTANRVEAIFALGDRMVSGNAYSIMEIQSGTPQILSGIGIDSTSTDATKIHGGTGFGDNHSSNGFLKKPQTVAGYHYYQWVEAASNNGNFLGDATNPTNIQSGMIIESWF